MVGWQHRRDANIILSHARRRSRGGVVGGAVFPFPCFEDKGTVVVRATGLVALLYVLYVYL